jgi:CRISPR/Cas system CSM-associated protein Csm3 (group 7 of RAMP superfamily)
MSSTKQLKRWVITGELTTETPLHIGDGGFLEGHKPEVARIVRDCNKKPYIPSSSLRGFLRSCAECLFAADQVEELFGYQEKRERGSHAEALGGLLQVWDGEAIGELKTENRHHVVINRRTRTAAEHLLFAEELICAGSQFNLTFVIDGVNATEDHVALLLGVLGHIHEHGFRLGAGTADNLGKVSWKQTAVKALTDDAVKNWLADKTGQHLNNHLEEVKHIPVAKPVALTNRLLLDIELHFEDRFLVKDANTSKDVQNSRNLNNSAIEGRVQDERALLDETSFLGALRSQCEPIARTIAGEHANQWVRDVTATGARYDNITNYTAVDYLFGGVGWLAPVRVEKVFLAKDRKKPTKQEFLAIDRFTGGGVNGLKYDANGFERPVIKGTVSIDLCALRYLHLQTVNPNVFADGGAQMQDLFFLLAFTLRDLEEGDIRFGFGASKGYGAYKATIKWGRTDRAYTHQALIDLLSQEVCNG